MDVLFLHSILWNKIICLLCSPDPTWILVDLWFLQIPKSGLVTKTFDDHYNEQPFSLVTITESKCKSNKHLRSSMPSSFVETNYFIRAYELWCRTIKENDGVEAMMFCIKSAWLCTSKMFYQVLWWNTAYSAWPISALKSGLNLRTWACTLSQTPFTKLLHHPPCTSKNF